MKNSSASRFPSHFVTKTASWALPATFFHQDSSLPPSTTHACHFSQSVGQLQRRGSVIANASQQVLGDVSRAATKSKVIGQAIRGVVLASPVSIVSTIRVQIVAHVGVSVLLQS